MSRRILRVIVEVEGAAFDPDSDNPYADTQAELEAILSGNLQTISSMDAGDVVTLRDTNGNRCGKVEMEDFPGDSPYLAHWSRLSDFALKLEEELPVSALVKRENRAVTPAPVPTPAPPEKEEEEYDEEAIRAFDEGQFAEPPEATSRERAVPKQKGASRPRQTPRSQNIPEPPGDPRMK